MDREAVIQYENKLKKEVEDKKVFDAIVELQSCYDYELRKKHHHNLVDLLSSCGYSVEVLPENPISIEIKILIRADLSSCIPRVNTKDLSALYVKNMGCYTGKYSDKDYQSSMQKSNCWKTIFQFTSFQKIYKHIVKKLVAKQTNPNVVENMGLMDCMHFVSENCKSSFKEYLLKKKFVQTFIRYNEEELRKMHYLQGVDIRYTDAMVDAMINDGVSCGIQVFDEKGGRIRGPEYDIHHRIPVKHAGEVQYFSEVNLFKNLLLVEKNIYHKLIHICEKSEYVANKLYFSKLLPPKCSVLISGLEAKDVLCYDFEKKYKIINPILENVVLPQPKNLPYKTTPPNITKQKPNFKHTKNPYKNKGGRHG